MLNNQENGATVIQISHPPIPAAETSELKSKADTKGMGEELEENKVDEAVPNTMLNTQQNKAIIIIEVPHRYQRQRQQI